MMTFKNWVLMTSLMITVALLGVVFTTEPVVVKECDITKPLSAGVEPGSNYKTWGEIEYLIEDGEYGR